MSKPVDVISILQALEGRASCALDAEFARDARAAISELIEAAHPLVARSFDEARNNEDQRIAAQKTGAVSPPKMLWCRADVLNPCWTPGTPYTGKHWGWTPDAVGNGDVCEHCRLRAALANVQGPQA